MRLVVLGLLMEASSHPYDLRRKMQERRMNHYMKIQEGSLYYAIEQLLKAGCIEVEDVVAGDGKPDKTIYRLTERGREEFERLLMRQFDEGPVINPLYAAIALSRHGDKGRVTEKLERKIEELSEYAVRMKTLFEEKSGHAPRSTLHLFKAAREHTLTEIAILRDVLVDARAGRLGERSGFTDRERDANGEDRM